MSFLLFCGHPQSGFQIAHAVCIAAGLPDGGLVSIDGACDQLVIERGSAAWCEVFQPERAEAFLLDQPQAVFVFVYAPLSWALIDTGSGTPDPDSAVAEWVSLHAALVGLASRYPERCMLVHINAALHAGRHLVNRLAEILDLPLRQHLASLAAPDRGPFTALAVAVSNEGTMHHRSAHALYRELESLALLDADTADASQAELAASQRELLELQRRSDALAVSEAAYLEVQAALAEHRTAMEEQGRRHDAALDEMQAIADGASKRARAMESELDGLKEALSTAQAATVQHLRAAEQWRQRVAQLEQEAAGDAAVAEARAHDLDLAQERIQVFQQDLSSEQERSNRLDAEAAALRGRIQVLELEVRDVPAATRALALNAQLEEMNELLSLQLYQVQEELESFHVQNKKLERDAQQARRSADLVDRWWRHNQPDDVVVDLRHEIDGSNWYGPEAEGRWFGPATYGTLVLPALRPGLYSVQVDLLAAMSPDMVHRMVLTLNGRELEISQDIDELPHCLIGTAIGQAGDGATWTLGIQLPSTNSPGTSGDDRKLGVLIRSVIFSFLESI